MTIFISIVVIRQIWDRLHVDFSGVRVTRSLVLCVCFVDGCLSFCVFLVAIVLSVLIRFMDSDSRGLLFQ
jgi:hypothetical protein